MHCGAAQQLAIVLATRTVALMLQCFSGCLCIHVRAPPPRGGGAGGVRDTKKLACLSAIARVVNLEYLLALRSGTGSICHSIALSPSVPEGEHVCLNPVYNTQTHDS